MGFFAWLFGKKKRCVAFKVWDAVKLKEGTALYRALLKANDPAVRLLGVVFVADPVEDMLLISTAGGAYRWKCCDVEKAEARSLAEYAMACRMSVQALCREYGMLDSTVRMRVKRGWTVEEALNINPWDKREGK